MILTTVTKVTKINRKSTSPAFKDLQIGDIIRFLVPIKSNSSTATYIECINDRTGQTSSLSFNRIEYVLSCCELAEYNPIYIAPENKNVTVKTDDEEMNFRFECTFEKE